MSAVLNLAGLTWGLPARWHPDEKADAIARMADRGLEPESFINPSLPLYLTLPVVWLQARAAGTGLLPGRLADPLLVSRALSALAGAAAVLVLALAVRREHPRLGTLPALLLAVSPGFVNLCHFATPEPWLMLGTALSLLAALACARGSAPAWVLGLVVGLTASTKYTAAALVVPALVAVLGRQERAAGGTRALAGRTPFAVAGVALLGIGLALLSGPGNALAAALHLDDARLLHPEHALAFVRGLAWSALAGGALLLAVAALAARPGVARFVRGDVIAVVGFAAAGFLAGTPYALLRPVAFLSDLAFNHQTRFEYKGLASSSASYLPYLGLLADAVTGPLLAAAAAGILIAASHAVLKKDATAAILVSAALAPYVLVASGGHQALRFLAPVLPPLAWLAAVGIAAIPSPRTRRVAGALVASRAALAALLVVRLFFVDARIQAGRWIDANVPRDQAIDVITNSPGYAPSPRDHSLRVVPTLSREMAPRDKFAEAARRYPDEASPWLVLTASYYERFLEHPEQAPERAAFFQDLIEGRGGFEIAARFRQRGWLRPPAEFLDPEIVVLKRLTWPAGVPSSRAVEVDP